jgi:hypothetical protein
VAKIVLAVCFVVTCFGGTCQSLGQPPVAAQQAIFPYQNLVQPTCLVRGCCDNYCHKPLPWIPRYCNEPGCDTYCRKPCPCVPPFPWQCGIDDYCCKPFPDLCRPLAGDYFTCATGCDQCSETGVSCGSSIDSSTLNQATAQPNQADPPLFIPPQLQPR